jgi:cytoskeleton-associated protein 5
VVGNIKPIMKVIPKIFGHTDKNVRAEGSTLVTTLYTFLGPALLPTLSDLKPVQMTELQKSFDSMDGDGKGAGTGRPTRYTRKAQRDREAAEQAGGDAAEEEEEEAPAAIDPKSLLDPINVLSLFPDNLDEMLSSTKWKERLEVLEECNKVLSQPANAKIADSNIDAYGSLLSTLGLKCKSDANINVVMEAAKVIEGLSTGLGRPFGRFRGVVMPGMIERLKERKANVVDTLGKALDAVFTTVSYYIHVCWIKLTFQTTLSDIVDDILTGCKSKNPQVKEGTLKFLHRSLQSTTDAPGKDQIKPLAEVLVTLLGDSAEPVRSSAADCLGTLMKILGERTFNPYVEKVPELQMAKVKDAFGRAEIKYKAGGKAAAPKAAASASAPVKKVSSAICPGLTI